MTVKDLIIILFAIGFSSCRTFQPLYKNNIENVYELQKFIIVTDKKPISKKIKKNLIAALPINKKSNYIVKIEASSNSIGTVNDASRSISRYKIEIEAKIRLYYRKKDYDQLLQTFVEKQNTPYNLVTNNIRSTLASRNKAEEVTIELITENIYRNLLIFFSDKKNVN